MVRCATEALGILKTESQKSLKEKADSDWLIIFNKQ